MNEKEKAFKKFKEENQEDIKKKHAIPVRLLKDFEVDYIFLTKHPILKKSLISEILYEGSDYEGGNED